MNRLTLLRCLVVALLLLVPPPAVSQEVGPSLRSYPGLFQGLWLAVADLLEEILLFDAPEPVATPDGDEPPLSPSPAFGGEMDPNG